MRKHIFTIIFIWSFIVGHTYTSNATTLDNKFGVKSLKLNNNNYNAKIANISLKDAKVVCSVKNLSTDYKGNPIDAIFDILIETDKGGMEVFKDVVFNPDEIKTFTWPDFKNIVASQQSKSIKVKCSVFDRHGEENNFALDHLFDKASKTFSFSSPTLVLDSFTKEAFVGEPITFAVSVSDPDGDLAEVAIDCDGDAKVDDIKSISGSSRSVSLSCSYDSPGEYKGSITAYDTLGLKNTKSFLVKVIDPKNLQEDSEDTVVFLSIVYEDGVAIDKLSKKDALILYPNELKDKPILRFRLEDTDCENYTLRVYKIWESDEYCDALIEGIPSEPEYIAEDNTGTLFSVNSYGCSYEIRIEDKIEAGQYSVVLTDNAQSEDFEILRFDIYRAPEELINDLPYLNLGIDLSAG
ncbi:MAG TPA: hypothetical protein EYP32_06190, partial [Aquificaceae bacterium]|nr:hypothetical protein [Aquificaceae bacterium]